MPPAESNAWYLGLEDGRRNPKRAFRVADSVRLCCKLARSAAADKYLNQGVLLSSYLLRYYRRMGESCRCGNRDWRLYRYVPRAAPGLPLAPGGPLRHA